MTATVEAPAPAEPPDDVVADGTDGPTGVEPPEPTYPVPAALAPWRDPRPWVGWAMTLLLVVIAGFTRFWAVGSPQGKNFDEVYYTDEAQELLKFGYEDNRGYMFIVHPPLGKWLIGLNTLLTNALTHPKPNSGLTDTLDWRLAPAFFGVLGVVILARTVRRMMHSNLFGFIAGLLMALEGMSLVLARTAILDIFLQVFVLAGFGALVVDRDKTRARLAGLIGAGADLRDGVPTLGPRPWRLIGGVMLGAACAVKWTALSFFVLLILLSFLWDFMALRAAGVRPRWWMTLRRSIVPGLGSLVAAPVGIYLLSYLGWFIGENGWNRHWADSHSAQGHLTLFFVRIPFDWGWLPGPIRSLGAYTHDAYVFHEGLDSGHPYASQPWNWLISGRPVDFYYNGSETTCGSTACSREVLDIATPLMWWAFVPMLIWLAWHWFSTHDWRATVVWVAFAAGWLVWFQDLKRTMFFFYMAPLVPFLIIGVTLGLGVMFGPALRESGNRVRDARAYTRRAWGAAGVSVYLGLVIADFVWMWPIFTGGLLTYGEWHARMWLPSWI